MKKARQYGNDPYLTLLEYRNTPWSDTLGSPAQRLMGRRTKTHLPASSTLLKPKTIDPKTVHEELQKQRSKQKLYYDRSAKSLKGLSKGDSVMMTKDGKWKPAKVVSINQTTPRSYNIMTAQGQQYRRNRKDLRKVAGGTNIVTNVDDFLDDEPHVANSTETTTDNSDDSEPVPPIIAAPAMRRSQRSVRAPVRYADEYS